MKRIAGLFSSTVVGLCLVIAAAFAGNQPPLEGGGLPDIVLPVPETPEQRAYLGLATDGTFKIPDIKAEVVIIEIFSMY